MDYTKDFTITSKTKFIIKGTSRDLVHLATIKRNFREFVLLFSLSHNKVYLNESTTGSFQEIIEDNLFNDLGEFMQETKLTQVDIDKSMNEQPFFLPLLVM